MDYKWLIKVAASLNIMTRHVDIDAIMQEFVSHAEGYIIYDDNMPDTVNVATTMAGIYNCVVIHPNDKEWIEKFGIRGFADLRGMFKDKCQAYKWAYENLWSKCNHKMLATLSPGPPICAHNPMHVAERDYVVALNLFAHYLDPRNIEELDLFVKLLQDMPTNTPILGWV